jgi:hypothetical protein
LPPATVALITWLAEVVPVVVEPDAVVEALVADGGAAAGGFVVVVGSAGSSLGEHATVSPTAATAAAAAAAARAARAAARAAGRIRKVGVLS